MTEKYYMQMAEDDQSFEMSAKDIVVVNAGGEDPNPGGTSVHSQLTDRDAPNQHPISAITGLEAALAGKAPAGNYLKAGDVPNWALQPTKPPYTAAEVKADPEGTTATHNTAADAHNDIRLLIVGLTERLNALANSDDTTLDQMAEVVAYIKDNRDLIEQITTGKVSVSDIIDNLTTNVANKPLSAAQGVVLHGEIGALAASVVESVGETLRSANTYTDDQIAKIPEPDVDAPVAAHNTAADAHGDIRILISALTDRLNALANSDDTTLDQMAEVVAYIKDNRELIEQVTTGKVSVTDIVNNLTTNVSNKPLSAAQGVVLKGLIDTLTKSVSSKLDASALPAAIESLRAEVKATYAFPSYASPTAFGCVNDDTLTTIVSTMPNNADCSFWVNDTMFPAVYAEFKDLAVAEGAANGYGPVTIRKRNNVANVEWWHYMSMLTLGNRWTGINNKGWSSNWKVLTPM